MWNIVLVCVYVYGWLDFRCFDIFNYVYLFYLKCGILQR